MQQIVYAPADYSAPLVMKIDLANGYYRVPISTSGIPHLVVVLPIQVNDDPLIAFPLLLPMSWKDFPP